MYPAVRFAAASPSILQCLERSLNRQLPPSRPFNERLEHYKTALEPLLRNPAAPPELAGLQQLALDYVASQVEKEDWLLVDLLNHAASLKETRPVYDWKKRLETALAKRIEENKEISVLYLLQGILDPSYSPAYRLESLDPEESPLGAAVLKKISNLSQEVIAHQPLHQQAVWQEKLTAQMDVLRNRLHNLRQHAERTPKRRRNENR
jgi:hypothetical protein